VPDEPLEPVVPLELLEEDVEETVVPELLLEEEEVLLEEELLLVDDTVPELLLLEVEVEVEVPEDVVPLEAADPPESIANPLGVPLPVGPSYPTRAPQ
jgi:hypothetical protein